MSTCRSGLGLLVQGSGAAVSVGHMQSLEGIDSTANRHTSRRNVQQLALFVEAGHMFRDSCLGTWYALA
jgi:hypothetical protein